MHFNCSMKCQPVSVVVFWCSCSLEHGVAHGS
uniref:Uncharacterized protein n=1 Tax=Arundo donax TaxID=35708 RepID=A0A0A8ZXB0_ARUDO